MVWKRPAAHGVQTPRPSASANAPGGHVWHAPTPAALYLPLAHGMHICTLALAWWYWPASHATVDAHADLLREPRGELCPTGHARHAADEFAPSSGWYVASAQRTHAARDFWPGSGLYVPGSQKTHGAPGVGLYRPRGHALHRPDVA